MEREIVNASFGKLVVFQKESTRSFIGRIASEVSDIDVVGLDLMDNAPLTFLAHIRDVELVDMDAVKELDAFKSGVGVCYIPEAGDAAYCYNDYLILAKGNVKLAEILFELSDWQHPETIFNELVEEGEIDDMGCFLIDQKS